MEVGSSTTQTRPLTSQLEDEQQTGGAEEEEGNDEEQFVSTTGGSAGATGTSGLAGSLGSGSAGSAGTTTPGSGTAGTGYSAQDSFERPVQVAQLGGPGTGQPWTGAGPAPTRQLPPLTGGSGGGNYGLYGPNGQWTGAGPAPGSLTPPGGSGLGPMYGPNGQWQGLGPSPAYQQAQQQAQYGALFQQAYQATPPGYSSAQVHAGLQQLMQQGYSQSLLSAIGQSNPQRLSTMLQGVMGPRPGPTIGAPQSPPFGVQMFGPPNENLGTGIFWQGINNFGPPGSAGAPSFPTPPTLIPRGGRGIPGR